jgi:hypothetical protein
MSEKKKDPDEVEYTCAYCAIKFMGRKSDRYHVCQVCLCTYVADY